MPSQYFNPGTVESIIPSLQKQLQGEIVEIACRHLQDLQSVAQDRTLLFS